MPAPTISVVTTNKNGGRFLRETIESVLHQTFKGYEHIIVDGASTDDSLAIIKSYPHLRWISEPDSSIAEGLRKALAMARGDYIMVTCVSDGYLSKTWFRRCVEVLDNDPQVSIVWGLSVQMTEDGDLTRVWGHNFFEFPPPQKQSYLPFWLTAKHSFPELNYCVRRTVYLDNFPSADNTDVISTHNPFLAVAYNLNTNGYLPYFIPILANFGRQHRGQLTTANSQALGQSHWTYVAQVRQYYRDLVSGRRTHIFRDGASRPIGKMSRVTSLSLPLLKLWHRSLARRAKGLRRRIAKRFIGGT